MSNTINFIRTQFTDYAGTSYGYRAYDDYEQVYSNNFESKPSEDDREFFNQVCEDGGASSLVDAITENESSICIDGTFYEYEEIKDWLK
jgi:hypothetical protein